MKKVFFIIGVVFLISSCKDLSDSKQDCVYSSSLSKTFHTLTNLQISTLESAIDIFEDYGLLSKSNRSSRELYANLMDLGTILPDDFSLVKRKCLAHLSVQERQAVLEEETSLQDEINELVKSFQESFKENLPDPTPALSLPFVDSTNEGLIIGDDSIIPFNSVQGAMTVEILNAVAKGENIKDLLTSFQSEINQEYEISERCLWTTDKNAWPNGDVYYRWGTILPNHKASVIEAMCIWYTKTLGTITFHELADNSWNNFLLFLGLIGCVNISDDFLDENVLGVSTVGYQGGFQTLKLSWQIQENMLKATCCHELGHTLGLRHEHQRPDRDFYISVPYVGSNFNPFPKEIDGFRWNSFTIDLFFFSITIYYPIWWSETYSETEGLFDFDSVMLYSGFPVHEQWQTFNHNKTMTQQQSEPSPFDVYMIMKQY